MTISPHCRACMWKRCQSQATEATGIAPSVTGPLTLSSPQLWCPASTALMSLGVISGHTDNSAPCPLYPNNGRWVGASNSALADRFMSTRRSGSPAIGVSCPSHELQLRLSAIIFEFVGAGGRAWGPYRLRADRQGGDHLPITRKESKHSRAGSFWHLTDVNADAQHVRFQGGKADIPSSLANVR